LGCYCWSGAVDSGRKGWPFVGLLAQVDVAADAAVVALERSCCCCFVSRWTECRSYCCFEAMKPAVCCC